jgi:hypothetical protein
MRSTRAAAAWAGIALATSFLSVTIVGTQPHTNATRAIAESVAMSSLPVNALGSAKIVKHTDVIDTKDVARAD